MKKLNPHLPIKTSRRALGADVLHPRHRRSNLKAPIPRDHQLPPPPQNRLPEKPHHPGHKARNVLNRQHPPKPRHQRIAQHRPRRSPRHRRPKEHCGYYRPPHLRRTCPKDQTQRHGLRKNLAHISQPPRTPRTPRPAQPMSPALYKPVIPDVMLNHAPRQHHRPPALVNQTAHHEILGQIALQMNQPADHLKFGLTRRNRASDREVHPVQQPLRQHARQEIRVETQRLHTRPKPRPSRRSIRTSHQPHIPLLQLRNNRGQTIRLKPDIAVRHHYVLVPGLRHQRPQAPHLGIRHWRRARHNQTCRHVREIRHQAARNRYRGVGSLVHGKQNFERRIRLREHAPQIRFCVIFRARQRPQH